MTATRAKTRGWWVSVRGRRITLKELCRFQGLVSVDIPDWQQAGISENDLCHMLGNSMSLNVCERVLCAALWSAGLTSRKLADPWA